MAYTGPVDDGPNNNSPSEFDFNLPCRFFKSSFARSLSLTNANQQQCKSLDYDARSNYGNQIKQNFNSTREISAVSQRCSRQAGFMLNHQDEGNGITPVHNVGESNDDVIVHGNEKPPNLPARRPMSLYSSSININIVDLEPKLQKPLTQLGQNGIKQVSENEKYTTTMSLQKAATKQDSEPHQQLHGHQQTSDRINKLRRNTISMCSAPNAERTGKNCTFGAKYHLGNLHQEATIPASKNDLVQQHHDSTHREQLSSQPYDMEDKTTNVEAVILQNQVDTLQWQLKQVETSCHMYRAVMEEVARFLERYYHNQTQQQNMQQEFLKSQCRSGDINNVEPIPRSKSLYQVHEKSTKSDEHPVVHEMKTPSQTYLRARSSTNLIDFSPKTKESYSRNKLTCVSKRNIDSGEDIDEDDADIDSGHCHHQLGLVPAHSYSTFKDFTWRRNVKKLSEVRSGTTAEDPEEKLNQDAFRLLRTINNFLNTSEHQPDLLRHHQTARHTLAPKSAMDSGRLSKATSTNSVLTLPEAPLHNSTSLAVGGVHSRGSTRSGASSVNLSSNGEMCNLASAADILFLRSANIRDSRLSLRSSTDSSVHSTSSAASSASSKLETDDDASHVPPQPILTKNQTPQHLNCNIHLTGSSTEDESGFSSISSFPDIGVPLNSTMISSTHSNASRLRHMGKELKCLQLPANHSRSHSDLQSVATSNMDNSTLKANVVGLPLNSSQDMSHRWDSCTSSSSSPSKTYHNVGSKYQRFSTLSNDESNTVLWV